MNSPYVPLCAAFAFALALAPQVPSRASAVPQQAAAPVSQPGDTLRFAGALERVLDRNPSLAAALARGAAAEGAAGQARAWRNPEILLEAENVGGGYSGLDQAELSLLVTQEFELGGRRGARASAARALADATRFDARTDSLELRAETLRRYADVVHAEEQLRIALLSASLVEELVAAAESRVVAGAAPLSDRALAAAALARAQMESATAESARHLSRTALASLWGDKTFPDAVAPLPVSNLPALPADSAATWAANGPAVTRSRLTTGALRAEHAVERSLRVPTMNAALGVRRVEPDHASTFLAALSFPIPLWDRRRDAVGAAQARVIASQSAAQVQVLETAGNLSRAILSYNRLRGQLRATRQSIAPRLREAADGLLAAYQLGSASYPDLLEVQRALIAIENEQNDIRRAIAWEIANIERLTGRSIEELGHE